jgi:hypothetical protein
LKFPQALLGGSGVEVAEVAFNPRIRYLLVELNEGTTREQLEGIKPDYAACLSIVGAADLALAIVTAKGLSGVLFLPLAFQLSLSFSSFPFYIFFIVIINIYIII